MLIDGVDVVAVVIVVTRDRMGRMLTFVARILQDDLLSKASKGDAAVSVARGVGVDEHTALLLDVTTGDVSAVGVGTAYVCSADHDPTICAAETPLTFKGANPTLLLSNVDHL